jgi:hypothetical protein
MLNEAFGVVIAGAENTFASPIGHAECELITQDGTEPARIIRAAQIAIFCGGCPPRHNSGGDGLVGVFGEACAHGGFFEVEQAEIIFSALARGDKGFLKCRIWIEAVEFLPDLALQVFWCRWKSTRCPDFFRSTPMRARDSRVSCRCPFPLRRGRCADVPVPARARRRR